MSIGAGSLPAESPGTAVPGLSGSKHFEERGVTVQGAVQPKCANFRRMAGTLIEIAKAKTPQQIMVPLAPNCRVSPALVQVNRSLTRRPANPVATLSKNVQRNICRMLTVKLLAVAAGTINRALMSNTPTAEMEKFTMSARSTMKR